MTLWVPHDISILGISWKRLSSVRVKGDNWSVKGPTKNLDISNAEVVLITVWGGVFPNQWEYNGLPYTQDKISMAAHNIPTDFQKLRPIQLSGQPQKSNYEGFQLGP